MFKFFTLLRKEILQLSSDTIGLLLMFLMPLLLVFIITIIQDGAYKAISENNLKIIVSNHDEGELGDKLKKSLLDSKMFEITDSQDKGADLQQFLLDEKNLIAIEIPENFSEKLIDQTDYFSSHLLGVEGDISKPKPYELADEIQFYHDPMLQENYVYSILNAVKTHLNVIQSQIIIEKIYTAMEMQVNADSVVNSIMNQEQPINRVRAQKSSQKVLPKNATQHNVPAWTIFAMFFMVVSLGNNIVKEKNSGSFNRIRMAPTNFFYIMFAKMLTYFFAAMIQIVMIFSVGMFVFPVIGMDALILPSNGLGFLLICVLCSLVAVSFAMLIGAYAKTTEQANGVGAILVVIFAAVGGIWVPVFVMPGFMQTISYFSPMRWCLEGFYLLFLQNASWSELSGIILFLFLFIVIGQVLTYIKLKIENLV